MAYQHVATFLPRLLSYVLPHNVLHHDQRKHLGLHCSAGIASQRQVTASPEPEQKQSAIACSFCKDGCWC